MEKSYTDDKWRLGGSSETIGTAGAQPFRYLGGLVNYLFPGVGESVTIT